MNALNSYYYSELRRSFNLDHYNTFNHSAGLIFNRKLGYFIKGYNFLFSHRKEWYKFDALFFGPIIKEFLDYFYLEALDDPRWASWYEDVHNKFIQSYVNRHDKIYDLSNLFVLNDTYNIEYTLLVVSEFKYYWKYRLNFYM